MDTAHRLLPASDRLLLGQLAGHYCSPLSLCEGLVITITWLFSIICITEMLCFGSLVNQGYCTHFWWRHWGFEVIFPSPLPVELLSEGKGRDGLRGGNICVDEKDGDVKWLAGWYGNTLCQGHHQAGGTSGDVMSARMKRTEMTKDWQGTSPSTACKCSSTSLHKKIIRMTCCTTRGGSARTIARYPTTTGHMGLLWPTICSLWRLDSLS